MLHNDFHDYVVDDLMSSIDGITSRAMFGGFGIYKDGFIFGLIADDRLYFKVDDSNKHDFETHGSEQFTYSKGNHKPTSMSYWEVPLEIMDDRNLLEQWIDKSVEVSKRSKKLKK